MRQSRSFFCACIPAVGLLLALELLILPLPGIQQDEALFLKPILDQGSALYSVSAGSIRVPIMVMDYVGCLKTWILWPLFRLWKPGVWSMRLPVCLVSVITLLAFAWLVRRIANSQIAIFAAFLLAADVSFVFTNVFDWGPVALLLLGLLGVLTLLVQSTVSASILALGGAFFLAGLMLWYKAIFAYPLAGVLIASAAVFPRQSWRLMHARRILVATGSLLMGVSPLLAFNLHTGGATLKASSYLLRTSVGEKLMMLNLTLNAKAFEHYLVRSRTDEVLPLTGAPIGELVESWYRDSTLGPGSFLPWALLLSCIALPFLRSSRLFRAIAFAWVAGLSTVALFLLSGTAGAGPHHIVLIYPIPQFIVAATSAVLTERLGSAPRRWILFGVLAIVTGSNLFLFANYHRSAEHNGFSVYWTDATQRLAAAIRTDTRPVAFVDWGIEDPARIQCLDAIHPTQPLPARPGVAYVTHKESYRIDSSETVQVIQDAASRGLTPFMEKTVSDTHGREILSIFSFRSLSAAAK